MMLNIGYINYIVILLVVTGILILRFDVKAYRLSKMRKEKKAAKFVGWLNIFLGVSLFIVNWATEKWFW